MKSIALVLAGVVLAVGTDAVASSYSSNTTAVGANAVTTAGSGEQAFGMNAGALFCADGTTCTVKFSNASGVWTFAGGNLTAPELLSTGAGTGLAVTNNATIGGTLGVTSTSSLADTVSCTKASGTGLAVTSNATVGGTLGVTGTSSLADTVSCTKASGTGLAVTSNATVGGTLGVTGVATLTATPIVSSGQVTLATTARGAYLIGESQSGTTFASDWRVQTADDVDGTYADAIKCLGNSSRKCTFAGGVTVNASSSNISFHNCSSATAFDAGSTTLGCTCSSNITVSGAALGDATSIGLSADMTGTNGTYSAVVTTTNTMKACFCTAGTAVDPASVNVTVCVTRG